MSGLRPEALTWTALLGKWVEFARASVALPKDAEGRRWRESVAPVINLQAVTFALADLARLQPGDRPVARDRAELLIRDNARRLDRTWRGEPMPEMLLEIAADARAALETSVWAGAVDLLWEGPGVMVMPEVPIEDEQGTLLIMQPGTLIMPGEPVAWWVRRDGTALEAALPGCVRGAPRVPHQVYRQLDERGRIVRDLVVPMNADLPAGVPLLVPLFEDGRRIGHFTVEAEAWEAQQRAAMEGEEIPVEKAEKEGKSEETVRQERLE